MGWEYDGNEDNFNSFVDANTPIDNNDYSDRSYDGIDSLFLVKFLPLLRFYNHNISIEKLSPDESVIIDFCKKSYTFLMFDSKGEYNPDYDFNLEKINDGVFDFLKLLFIRDYSYDKDDYLEFLHEETDELDEIEKKDHIDWKKELFLIDFISKISNHIIPRYEKIMREKDEYLEELNIDISQDQKHFLFNFKNTPDLRKPCIAIEVLSLAYANKFDQSDCNQDRTYSGHILDDINEFSLLEKVIERIGTKLNYETAISNGYSNELKGKFEDGSEFNITSIQRPQFFGCIDNVEVENKMKELQLESDNTFETNNLSEYIDSIKDEDEFADLLYKYSNEDVSISIKFPKKSDKLNDFSESFIWLHFDMPRSVLIKENPYCFDKQQIIKIKSKNTIDSLLAEADILLKNNYFKTFP